MGIPDSVPLQPSDTGSAFQETHVYEGKIATDASRWDDSVYLVSDDFGGEQHTFGPSPWHYRGDGILPRRGDACWFAFEDNNEVVIVNWKSETAPPSVATDAELAAHTSLVLGAHGIPSRLNSGEGLLWNGSGWSASTLTTTSDERVFQPGMISMHGSRSSPTGWLLCDGSAVSRSRYASLFAALSTTYGSGDGSTTFNIPDLCGRVPIGAGTGRAGLTVRTLGTSLGEEAHALTNTELPANAYWVNVGSFTVASTPAFHTFNVVTGGGRSHNNMQPSLPVYYIIKT